MTRDAIPSRVDPVDELAEEYLRRRRRGEHPTPGEYAARYPEHAARILEFFPALELIEGLKPTPAERAGFAGDAVGFVDPAGGGPRRLGAYTLLREIGRGGMGIVYAAEHDSLKSRVALKVMHPRFRADRDYVRRFQTEARSAAKLHHTNIVPVFDYGEQDGVCFYAMQYIVGVGLERVLEDVRRLRAVADPDNGAGIGRGGQQTVLDAAASPVTAISRGLLIGRYEHARTISLIEGSILTGGSAAIDGASSGATSGTRAGADGSAGAPIGDGAGSASSSFAGQPESIYFREVARLGAQVADALDYAHRQGVIHRDIKPPNLLLDTQGNVWVTDFGLAKLVDGDELSQSHNLIGTLRFMAPERFRGITNPLGDVYSLGATLYELLTLYPVFAERDLARLIDQITRELPPPLRRHDPRIPRDLETLVQKALAKDPKDRFVSAAELGDELRRYLESRSIRSRPSGPVERVWRWCKRSPGLAAACILAGLLTTTLAISMTIAAWIFYHQRGQISQALVQARDSAAGAIKARADTRLQLLEALQARARAGRLGRQVGQRFESLDALAQAAAIARELKLSPDRFDLLRNEAIACLALPDLKKTGRVVHLPQGVILTAFDSAMTRYALRFRDGTIQVRSVADDSEIARFQARGDREIEVFELSPDGRYLATTDFPGFALSVWDVDQRALALNDNGPIRWRAASFSPDSRRIVLIRESRDFVVHDLADQGHSRRWSMPFSGHLAFGPDGAQIAVMQIEPGNPNCRILESQTGRLVRSIKLPGTGTAVAWSHDGTTLATTCEDHKIYLWDPATGARKATLEGHTNSGLTAAFHPAGTLLASCGWDGRAWLWDPVLGRPWLNLTGDWQEFSRDGRIVITTEDKLTSYEADPALAYRTYAHVFGQAIRCWRASIRNDGRILALGTDRGVALWDLARGAELPFLPIGKTWGTLFEGSGDLVTVTSGSLGAQRWHIQLDQSGTEFRMGPPRPGFGTAEDQSGKTTAIAHGDHALVSTPERTTRVGPLDDCRFVAVSPDGQWLATGSHFMNGAQVWHIPDGARVADLKVNGGVEVAFSPDGKWLMTHPSPCRLWAVGTWTEARRIGGDGYGFSPDGRHLLVQDANKVLRLVEVETGRTAARLESPDLCSLICATFSPDGSKLAVVTNDGPAAHVWDLRTIRKHLAEMGLDWDAPAYPDNDPAGPLALPLPPLRIDYGRLGGAIDQYNSHLEQNTVAPEELLARYTERLKEQPDDPDSLHQRGHALLRLGRFDQALTDFAAASARRPHDCHLRAYRGICLFNLKQYATALDQLESAFQTDPETVHAIFNLDQIINNHAWAMVTGPKLERDRGLALRLAAFSVALEPGKQTSLNTLGVALYRAGKFAEAITTLEKSLGAGQGQFDAFDLFFLAMAHQRLGHRDGARTCYDRAVAWIRDRKDLNDRHTTELTAFRAEAAAVLAGSAED